MNGGLQRRQESSQSPLPNDTPKGSRIGTVYWTAVHTPAPSGQEKVLFKQDKLANVLQRQKAFGTSNTEEPHATSQGEFRR